MKIYTRKNIINKSQYQTLYAILSYLPFFHTYWWFSFNIMQSAWRSMVMVTFRVILYFHSELVAYEHTTKKWDDAVWSRLWIHVNLYSSIAIVSVHWLCVTSRFKISIIVAVCFYLILITFIVKNWIECDIKFSAFIQHNIKSYFDWLTNNLWTVL